MSRLLILGALLASIVFSGPAVAQENYIVLRCDVTMASGFQHIRYLKIGQRSWYDWDATEGWGSDICVGGRCWREENRLVRDHPAYDIIINRRSGALEIGTGRGTCAASPEPTLQERIF